MKTRSDYLRDRERYTPTQPETIFVLESPPESGRYFYDEAGSTTEPLFKAMMVDVLDLAPGSPGLASKADGLAEFCSRGFLLVDATYTPVNGFSDKRRNELILSDFPRLVDDLRKHSRSETGIVLVKVNVCDLLETRLTDEGFRVLNEGKRIPFPATGNQQKFRVAVRQVLRPNSLDTE